MAKRVEISPLIVDMWECEVCGKETPLKEIAEKCEREHACEHKETRFSVSYDDDDDYGVLEVCKQCEKTMRSAKFYEMGDKQELLKKIFELIRAAG